MRWSTCEPGQETHSPPPLSSNSSYKCVQNTDVWGVVLVLFAWFCFGLDFFRVKQRK